MVEEMMVPDPPLPGIVVAMCKLLIQKQVITRQELVEMMADVAAAKVDDNETRNA